MFFALRRRIKVGLWKHGWCYFSSILAFILFTNVLVIQRNFAALEGENFIDSGVTARKRKVGNLGTDQDVFLKRRLHEGSETNNRYVFEDRLRNLLRFLETNLEKTASPSNTKVIDSHFERYFSDRLLFCDEIRNITKKTYLASGWTKAVYKGYYKGSPVALKTVDLHGQDVGTCVKSGRSQSACYVRAAKKVIKEIVVLQALANPNVLKVSNSTQSMYSPTILTNILGF